MDNEVRTIFSYRKNPKTKYEIEVKDPTNINTILALNKNEIRGEFASSCVSALVVKYADGWLKQFINPYYQQLVDTGLIKED